MKKLVKFLNKKVSPSPSLVVATGIFAVMLITAIGGIANYSSEINQKSSGLDASQSQKIEAPFSKTAQTETGNKSTGSSKKIADSKSDRTVVYQNQSQVKQTNDSSSPPKTTSSQYINVTLNIEGAFAGQVSLKKGSDHCQVLTNALSQGKIKSLNMRENKGLGSYAVYRINGTGDTNAVWWVYDVFDANGRKVFAPGCSYLKAENGQSVYWKYTK